MTMLGLDNTLDSDVVIVLLSDMIHHDLPAFCCACPGIYQNKTPGPNLETIDHITSPSIF